MSENLSPRQVFLLLLALTATLNTFGYWKPGCVFNHACDNPRAFFGDVWQLLRHRAIYPVILINLLWYFTPGANTPMQFYLSNQLHLPDSIYANFQDLLNLFLRSSLNESPPLPMVN